jgi:hypothetical protein
MLRHSGMKDLPRAMAAGRAVPPGRVLAGLTLAGLALAGLVLAGTAGCSSSGARPRHRPDRPDGLVAEVTGFRDGSIFGLSGPVTVRVTGWQASRLARLVSQLPSAPQPECEEPLALIYRITFGGGSAADSTAVDGYRCGAGVTTKAAGETVLWRRDATCTLIAAVRQVLPARARATQRLAIGCDS